MNALLDAMSKRRSVYSLNNHLPIPESELEITLATISKHAPTAFNMQSSRMVLLLPKSHKKLWDGIVYGELLKTAPPENLTKTKQKLDGFARGYGTLLFFEETPVVKSYAQRFLLYQNLFPDWSLQQNGMLQFAAWAALADKGVGASLQHYNPVIDSAVKQEWGLPNEWRLLAQMPFGGIAAKPDDKDSLPIEEKFLVR